MKATFLTIALSAASVLIAAPGFAEETPAALSAYGFPTGANLKLGQMVRPAFSEDFQKSLQEMLGKLSQLPKEKQEAIAATFDATELSVFNAELWDQESYNAYKTAFKDTKVQPVANAALGLQSLGNNEWRMNSVVIGQNGKPSPIFSLGALRYNADKNVWTSNNGEMQASSYTGTTDSVYGAQNGTEWKLEKADDFSLITERLRFARTTDGKFVYVVYQFRESSALSHGTIAQDGYVLRFPVGTISASIGNQTKH